MARNEVIDLTLSSSPRPFNLRPRSQESLENPALSPKFNSQALSPISREVRPDKTSKRQKLSPPDTREPIDHGFILSEDIETGKMAPAASNSRRQNISTTSRKNNQSLADDPIIFTSSPREIAADMRESRLQRKTSESSDELPDFPAISNQSRNVRIKRVPLGAISPNGRKGHLSPGKKQDFLDLSDLELDAPKPIKTRSRVGDKEAKAREKAAERERKAQAKEAERERKRILNEEKAMEKQKAAELEAINRARKDKKESVKEMIVDLPSSLQGKTLDVQIRALLQNANVEIHTWDSSLPNIVKWRRRLNKIFNEDLGHWQPTPERIENEKHMMCFLTAQEFVDLVQADTGEGADNDLDSHILKMKSQCQGATPIYLLEGMVSWMRRNKTIRNRAYQAAVLSQMSGDANAETTSGQQRRKKKVQEYIDEDVVEDALLRLQVIHKCLIHHTAAPVETAEWIITFTEHISTIPYKTERMNLDTSFCMEVGQVRTGENTGDTYTKMLQEIVRVTAPVAYGIAAEYPNVVSLIEGLKTNGPTALENLRKTANRNGALTEQRVGPAISKRVYKVFMGTDPMSNDV